MQITSNTTGMVAEIAVTADAQARDHCIVVVKGTFVADSDGRLSLADEQVPPIFADVHYGDPESSAVRAECDFALSKPLTDVLVDGFAIAPGGRPVSELPVALEVQGRRKDVLVVGERRWVSAVGELVPSSPVPFTAMPLTFDRAFGGMDDSKGPGKTAVEARNLVGVGFHAHRPPNEIAGTALPNLEHPGYRIGAPRDRPPPVGFGCVGRAWKPRIAFAGTYDERWQRDVAPFLPADFDARYFQAAPEDQQFPHFRGGEFIRCVHMAERPVVSYRIPSFHVPVVFRFKARRQPTVGVLDTVTLKPHDAIALLVWRASIPLGKRLHDLHAVEVGPMPADDDGLCGYRNGKPVFRGLKATLEWISKVRGSRW